MVYEDNGRILLAAQCGKVILAQLRVVYVCGSICFNVHTSLH